MRGRWLLNLGLALLAGVLALLLLEQPGVTPPPAPERLSTRDPSAVQKITVRRGDSPAVVLERGAERAWRIVAPFTARADARHAEGLAQLLAAQTSAAFAAEPVALAQYGLARPSVVLDLDGFEIALGATHPIGRERYVLADNKVQLVSETVLQFVPADATDLVDPRLFEPGVRPVAIDLPGFRLEKGEKAWRLDPANEQPSQDRLLEFVDDWREARALSVQRQSGHVPTAQVTVTLEAANGERIERHIGVIARAPELVLLRADEGLQYRFPAALGARLFAPPSATPEKPAADPKPALPPTPATPQAVPAQSTG